MVFLSEPQHNHGQAGKTAILLVNLGTPEAPTASALRPYLKEFLWDPRVVEIPRALWWLILHAVILPFRSGQSAKKYASIWTPDGSPLKVHTEKQARLLRGYLGQRGQQVEVAYAMRYGKPAIPEVLNQLKIAGAERILILPAYPQYSAATTASIHDAVFAHLAQMRNLPELRFVRNYHDHAGYIDALAATVTNFWEGHRRPDKLVMSFHGVPKRTLTLGDPYYCECHKTARLLAERLGLNESEYLLSFQSRFGKAEWLQPYTAPSVKKLAQEGVKRVDVVCPGFTSDCLETLEEIAMEVRAEFLTAGGKEFNYIPCLNESPDWIHALADISQTHMQGWPTAKSEQEARNMGKTAQLARNQGAKA
ncbi:MAG: ferrochelatase [Burkholderiaceae bacterium]|nr:ferrochelatase [Burkholderiaceae bacterium]